MTKDEALAEPTIGTPSTDPDYEHSEAAQRKADGIDAALAEPQGWMLELPELPETSWRLGIPAQPYQPAFTTSQKGYDADQMYAYGRACAEAARKEDEALMRLALDALEYLGTLKRRQAVAALRTRLVESHE